MNVRFQRSNEGWYCDAWYKGMHSWAFSRSRKAALLTAIISAYNRANGREPLAT